MSTDVNAMNGAAPEKRSLYSEDCLQALARWQGIEVKPDSVYRGQREGIRIFRSTVMEIMLTKAPPILPWIWSVPLMVVCCWWALTRVGLSVPLVAGLFAAGIVLWTLMEYILHRFLFHFTPKSEPLKTFFFLTHGYHHEFPDDKLRLVAPPLMFLTLGVFFSLGYWLLFRSHWTPLFAGTLAGYLAYDMAHYYAHHARPKSRIGKFLRNYHLRHHFEDSEVRYGISSPLWDFIFGTYRPLNK